MIPLPMDRGYVDFGVYAKDFEKNEIALARYLRGLGFKALQRTQKIL